MTSREPARLANGVSRVWLLSAGLALLLPYPSRLGFWLPLHLALAGAVSGAISGNMTTFAWALTSTPSSNAWVVRAQLFLITLGAALIAVGFPHASKWAVAAGGACFVGGAVSLLLMLASAWRRSLNRRHAFPMAMYAVAVTCVIGGGTIGALLGSGAVGASAFEHLRDAHMVLNVLGWASLTIVATLSTLLPTVLRIRIPRWRPWRAFALLTSGVGVLALGLGTDVPWIAGLGAAAYWVGGMHLAVLVVRGVAGPRRWPAPGAARHMIAGFAWFLAGGGALTWACFAGTFERFLPSFELMFVCGWLLQILLGSWLYLLPTIRAGDPERRRLWFAAVDLGIDVQVLVLNMGLVLVLLATAHAIGRGAGWAGAAMALVAAGVALTKTVAFPALAHLPAAARRSRETWGR